MPLCLLPPLLALIVGGIVTHLSVRFPEQNPYTAYVDEDNMIKTLSNLRRTRNRNEAEALGPIAANASANSNSSESRRGAVNSSAKDTSDQQQPANTSKEQTGKQANSNTAGSNSTTAKADAEKAAEKALAEKKKEAEAAVKDRELDPFKVNAGRMIWGSISIIYVCVCAATLAAGLYIINSMFKEDSESHYKRLGIALIVIVCILLFVKFCHFSFNNYLALPGLVENTVNRDWTNIIDQKHGFEYLIVFMGLFLTVVCGTLIWDYVTDKNKLVERMRLLRLLLYLAAALLVMKVLQSSQLLDWSLIYLNTGDNLSNSIKGITASMLTQESLGYTVFLAALYLPSFVLLRSWATQAGVEADSKGKGLLASFGDQLPKILAMISPLLAGPIKTLLENISK